MLNVIMPSVIMVNVVAPLEELIEPDETARISKYTSSHRI